MKVPYIDLSRHYSEHKSTYLNLANQTYLSGQMFCGDGVKDLEDHVATLVQKLYGVAVGSGSDALFIMMSSLGIGPNDDVLVPAFSYIATAHAVVRTGANPIFVDVDDNFMMDLDDAKNKLTPNTRGLLFATMFGQVPNYYRFEHFAMNGSLILMEDNAQSFGASWDNRPAGSAGMASAQSFDPMKPFGSFNGGGMILTDMAGVARIARLLRHQGKENDSVITHGFNSKMSSFDAAVIRHRLETNEIEQREQIHNQYMDGLQGVGDLVLPKNRKKAQSNYHKFVVLTEQRDALEAYLQQFQIGTRRLWPRPLYKETPYSQRFHVCPNAERICSTSLGLPMFPGLTEQEVDYVIQTIKRFFSN